MSNSHLLGRTLLGAAGGFVGTLAIQAMMTADKKWAPRMVAPMRREPGEYMVEKVEEALPDAVRRRVPEMVEKGAAQALAVGYGVTFGALYAIVRPRGGSPLLDGAALGLACWAAGYLGWLPALGITPPITKQKTPQIIGPVAQHLAYGVTTVGAYNLMHRCVE